MHTCIESLISAPFFCLFGPPPWLQPSQGGRPFHGLAQWAEKSHSNTHTHTALACHRGSASYSSLPSHDSPIHFLSLQPWPGSPEPFYWVYSPLQWLSRGPGSPSLGREPARPAQSSCGETASLQPRRPPDHPSSVSGGLCLKIHVCMCVYPQDEQPAGLFGQSQQDKQTNYKVKQQQ